MMVSTAALDRKRTAGVLRGQKGTWMRGVQGSKSILSSMSHKELSVILDLRIEYAMKNIVFKILGEFG